MGIPLRLLIVEDSEDDAALLLRELQRGGYDVAHERVDSPDALISALERQKWDLVVSDHSMPHFTGIDALHILRSKGLRVPFIFVSGTIGE
jgi:CheY-like chemotaxis protein